MSKRARNRRSQNRQQPRPAEVVKAFGPAPGPQIQAGIQRAGMDTGRAFGPGEPIGPYDGYSRNPRAHNFTTGYNIAARPRNHERVTFDVLRGLVESYDIAQIAIWHRIDSIRSLGWNLKPLDGVTGDVDQLLAIGKKIMRKPDRKNSFSSWVARYAYDALAYDAATLYRMRNNAGRVIGLKNVDGTTIAPMIDDWGDRPDSPAPAYVQFANGVPWNWLTEDDVIYAPFRPTTASPYGRAPIESIILNANTNLRFQLYFMQRFTSGNVPEGFAGAPEGWTPDEIERFQTQWDAMMYGDQEIKSQVKWVPNGTTFAWSNEKDFSDEFSLFMMRITAAAYSVTPADLGFTEDVNRASGDTQADVQFRIGDGPLLGHLEDIIDEFLQDDVGLPLEFIFDRGAETEDRLQTAQADEIYVNMGAISASEVRERVHGLPEPGGAAMPRFIMTSRGGPVPWSAIQAVAGELDADTGSPVPGADLSKKPFAPVEGVIPNPPPAMPALAVQKFGEQGPPLADTAAPVVAPAPLPSEGTNAATGQLLAPVAKEATAGITTATGIVGNPMVEDDDETEPVVAVSKSAELAAFRSFVKQRRRRGDWRDFIFKSIDDESAARLNTEGRLEVRKAAGQLIAAGLCVQATDTGRVLMLQRGFDPTDPASGMWEFPGGHIEDGENPAGAAGREWMEETGCLLPIDLMAQLSFENCPSWTGTNGIYQGYVLTVPSETSVAIHDRGQVINPDDPDGDSFESVAWWAPRLLPGNPAVRAELAESLDLVIAALAPMSTAPAAPPIVEAIETEVTPSGLDDIPADIPAEVAKAGEATSKDARWHQPVRKAEQRLIDAHAEAVQAALEQSVTKQQLHALAAAYVAQASGND